MTERRSSYTFRPGKYIEYDFPLREVNRLAQKEAPVGGRRPIYFLHKWWARRLSCVFRTVLLASAVDWADWDALEPWKRDADGDFVDAEGNKIIHERDYHRRVRDGRPSVEWHRRTNGLLERPPTAWERLYYRLDEEAELVIEKAFWGKLVLDPFMGGGTTIVEAMRLGADVAGVDLNPVAWLTVKKETDDFDLATYEAALQQVEMAVADEIRGYYKTCCPACGETADALYIFWVKLARCLEHTCGAEVPLYNSFILARDRKKREVPADKDGTPGMHLASGEGESTYFLVCSACGEVYASFEQVRSEGSTCPACGQKTPADLLRDGYSGGGNFTCPTCGTGHAIVDATKEQGLLPNRMYALQLHCSHCDFKGYKKPDADDLALYERARQRFEVERPMLRLPEQEIPPGYNTYIGNPLPDHGYQHWLDMFNERQLLLLARLRDAILGVQDANTREYLLVAFSSTLDYNNMFCQYEPNYRNLQNLYVQHAIRPTLTSAENNVFGIEAAGKGTFLRSVQKVQRAKAYWSEPYETWLDPNGRTRKVFTENTYLQPSKAKGKRRLLFCRSSEDLSMLDDGQAALVVTDPPYYGNVMYAELSDFFYVWLRSGLRKDHPEVFSSQLAPKDEEVVDQKSRAPNVPFLTKDEAFFTAGLTRIFNEAGRCLAADGLMVFTFHHQANEAWASVLRTVLDAGFFIKAVYPVHAENVESVHIRDKANISYDALIVCRKQVQEPKPINWRDVADRVYLRAERLVKELEDEARGLLPEDIYVIAIGKCLEEYSCHYFQGRSYVFWQDQPVGIEEALDGSQKRGIQGIGEIVDQLVEEAEGRLWPAGLDPVSRFYVINFLGQSEVLRPAQAATVAQPPCHLGGSGAAPVGAPIGG